MFKRASTQIMTHGTEVLRGPTIAFTLMSALGQKQPWQPVSAMSALPPKADIAAPQTNVPKADISHILPTPLAAAIPRLAWGR